MESRTLHIGANVARATAQGNKYAPSLAAIPGFRPRTSYISSFASEAEQLHARFGTKRRRLSSRAHATARDAINRGKHKFEGGDRVGALREFEGAVKQPLSQEELQEALYAATVVHASFGDIEQAQVSLRESLDAGLDFEAALIDRSMLSWKSSPQVLSQLKKFARTLKQIREAVAPSRSRSEVPGSWNSGLDYASSDRERLPNPNPNTSLSEMLRTDITGMDATVTGIVKRVSLLLIVGILLGTALFYIGLEFSGIAR